MDDRHSIEQRTLKLYEDIHPFNRNEVSILNYLKTTGLDEAFFKNKKILDCGFGGTGWALELFARSGASLVAGVELNEKWCRVHRERLLRYPCTLDLRVASALDLPFADASFDFVHSNGVLHHTVDWKKGIAELARVTRPGGMVFVMLYGKFAPVGRLIHGTYRLLGRLIPYRLSAFISKKTGFLRNPEYSMLDAMYAPVETHLSFEEIRAEFERNGLGGIRWLPSYKWTRHKILSSPLVFGPKMQHNILATKLKN